MASSAAALHVSELKTDVNEGMLHDEFSKCGPIATVRVVRDPDTRESRGYAYVNFATPADAETAMDTMNYAEINGKQCRLQWATKDHRQRQNTNANVYVKNVDRSVDSKRLHNEGSMYGSVVSAKVATDSKGKHLGFGFLQYSGEQDALNAIEKMNGTQLGGRKIFVGAFVPSEKRPKMDVRNYTNLYVKNMAKDFTKEQMGAMFQKFGDVTSFVLNQGKSGLAYGYVNYKDSTSAKKAVEALHRTDLRPEGERKKSPKDAEDDAPHPDYLLYVQRAMPLAERERAARARVRATGGEGVETHNLYIKNLPLEWREEQLKKMFAPFGKITSCRVVVDEKGESKGFGFVMFSTAADAAKAVAETHLTIARNGKPLYVGLFERKEARQQRMAQRFRSANALSKGLGKGASGGDAVAAAAAAAAVLPGYPGFPYGMPRLPFPGRAPAHLAQLARGMPGAALPGGPAGVPGMFAMPMINPMTKGLLHGKGGALPARVPRAAVAPFPAGTMPPNVVITNAYLDGLQPALAKQMLGEKLFPKVADLVGHETAAKLTGMMLEMKNAELVVLLEDPTLLKQRVAEAHKVLEEQKGVQRE